MNCFEKRVNLFHKLLKLNVTYTFKNFMTKIIFCFFKGCYF